MTDDALHTPDEIAPPVEQRTCPSCRVSGPHARIEFKFVGRPTKAWECKSCGNLSELEVVSDE